MNLRIIYVDVLLIVNFYMNYLLLAFTAKITRTKMQLWRGIFSAGLGSFSALMIFLPEMNAFCSWLCKLFTAGMICLFAFGKNDFFRKWLYYFGMSFFVAGGMLAISSCTELNSIYHNSSWYMEISLLQLFSFTVIAYGVLSFMQYVNDKFFSQEKHYQVFISYHEKTAILTGLADTGNALTDFYTGKAVIVCDKTCLNGITPEHSHYLPYLTVAGSGLLEVFQPEEVKILPEGGKARNIDVVVGIGLQENGKAIFHPKLLRF